MPKYCFWTISQMLLPQRFLSYCCGKLATCRKPWLKNFLIRCFLRRHPANMNEAIIQDPYAYPDFNHFFTRSLRPDMRPIAVDPNSLVSPADGQISEVGTIQSGQLLQAKDKWFDVPSLLGDATLAMPFQNGLFATIYLAPIDYHRVHMPFSGRLLHQIAIPGRLFSVNEKTTNSIPELFARNERVVFFFATDFGPLVVVMVGALLVSSIHTAWGGPVLTSARTIERIDYLPGSERQLQRGDYLGHFQFGSTCLILLPEKVASWRSDLIKGSKVRFGEAIASYQQTV